MYAKIILWSHQCNQCSIVVLQTDFLEKKIEEILSLIKERSISIANLKNDLLNKDLLLKTQLDDLFTILVPLK